ncbi:hypothetical protein N7523_003178 [Penicillium sp. IBT 18751x]|nr:hypothetical protein N7523_003178 [Penicillium sp. IBT 18751x]
MLRVLPCGHQYHMKCIADWLQRASSCPVCRIDLKPKAQQKSTPTITKTGVMTPDLEQGQTQTRHIRSLQDRIVEDLYGLR